MREYTPEELASLSNIFLKSQFAAQYYYGENGRLNKLETSGKIVDGLARRRLVYLGDLYLGFTSELFAFLKNDPSLISRLNSTKEQRSRLNAIRNYVFHAASSKVENKRFREFKTVNKDWKIALRQDLEIIGEYIYEIHRARNPANARLFKNYWMRLSAFR